MGLDMYGYARTQAGENVELQYWRKHPNLHGWMEKLWNERGRPLPEGSGVNVADAERHFNCIPLELSPADIDRLEQDLNANALPATTGFFFGQSLPEDTLLDRAFILRAREAFAAGHKVFYDSWW